MEKVKNDERKYSPEHFGSVNELNRNLSKMSEERQSAVATMANTFIAGMEAQRKIAAKQ